MVHTRKLVAVKVSSNFREATQVVEAALPEPSGTDVIVQNFYVGINASDVNFTAGVYVPGIKPPFDCGFESLGRVVAVGNEVTRVKVGDAVAFSGIIHSHP